MANTKPKNTKSKSPLVGNQAKPTVLDSTTKLDIDTNKVFIDNIIDAGINGGLNLGALENFTSISNNRDQIYTLIDTMAADSSVSAIVRTYAEEVCETSDNGHVVWCESQDPKVSKFINYLLNVMNVDKNIYNWTYNLIKYGDVYLRLYRESDYEDKLFKKDNIGKADMGRKLHEGAEDVNESVTLNMHTANDPYSYYVEMVPDPSTMFELTKYGKTYGYIETPNADIQQNYLQTMQTETQNYLSYRMKSSDVNVYQADDFVHACLEDNVSRYPETVEIFTNQDDYTNSKNALTYKVRRGKSLLYDSYKIWREKQLLENAALLNRITRSSIVRNIQVEVGNMPKEQVQLTLRRIKELFEQKSSVNVGNGMTEYTNPGAIENNIFTATHNGQGAITVNSVGGDVDVKNLADLDWWNNKFYSSYGIPKQYFGWTDDSTGFNGGSSLTILSSVFAKGVKRVQNAILQAITDSINLILVNKGLKAYLNNFVLKMRAPLTQEEVDYRSNLTDRINAISNLQSLFTDVEDKVRRLEILKSLVATLNYGDDIIEEIEKEIEAAKQAKKEKAEKEAEEAKAAEAEAASGEATETTEEAPAEESDEELDLGMAEIATEGIKEKTGEILLEDTIVESDDDLPTPEEVNEKIDFSKNK